MLLKSSSQETKYFSSSVAPNIMVYSLQQCRILWTSLQSITGSQGRSKCQRPLPPRKLSALIPNGATIGATGSGLACWPEEVARGMAARFRETGQPKGLTLMHSSAIGDWKERGTTVLGMEGLVKRLIASHIGGSANMSRLVTEGQDRGLRSPRA